MTYTATYDADDVSVIVIDGLGIGLVTVLSFLSIIVLVLIYKWFRKNAK